MKTPRLIRFGDAFSQFMNVLIFNGDPNHSISGDAYRYKRESLRRFIDWVFFWDPDHCRVSHENDIKKGCALCAENGHGCHQD